MARAIGVSGILLALLGEVAATRRAEGQGTSLVRAVVLAPCQTGGQIVQADLSTGASVLAGQQDPHWQLITVPPSLTGSFPAYSTNPLSSWVTPTPPAKWIQRVQNTAPQPDSIGSYIYRLQFNLNPALYSSIQIVGNYAGDNSAFVQLNGVPKAGCPGNLCFQGLYPLSINSGFVNGVNNLDVIVNNANAFSATGLLVEAKLQATCGVCAWAPTGMVAWWPLDETSGMTVADIVGGLDGTAQPGPIGAFTGPGPVTSASWPPPAFPAGMVGTSLFFSGTRRVEVSSNPAIEPGIGDFSMDAWVIYSAAGTGNSRPIISKSSTAGPGYLLNIQDVSTTQGLLSFVVSGPSVAPILTANITPQTWHHVAATLQRGSTGNMALYIDGALVGSGPVGLGGSVSNALNLLIGGDGVSKGEIAVDEVELFNRSLSQTEIQDIFKAGAAGKCRCVSPPSDMVAWWPFDETGGIVVHDIADGNNGTSKAGPVGSGGPTPGPGMVAGALNFNGTSDFVQVSNAPNLNFGAGSLSIDAWIKTGSGTGLMPIVDKEIIGFPITSAYGYNFYVRNGHLGFSMSSDINVTPHESIGVEDTTHLLADNQWHYVAVTVERNSASLTGGNLFIDGATIATATFSTLPLANLTADNTGDLILGAASGLIRITANAYFNGSIDEVEIFRRALAPAEMQNIYRAGSAGKCQCVSPPSGMVAWYPLDDPPGPVVHDIWTHHLDGTPQPGPLGGTGPIPMTGHVGGSLYGFAVSYVDVPDSPYLNFFHSGGTGEFSIDAWVKISASICCGLGAIDPVVDKTLVSGSSVTGYALYLYTAGPGTHLALTLDGGTPVTSPTLVDPTPLPATRNWQHVAVTVARPAPGSANVTLYVNGAPWSAATIPVGNTDNIENLWIGHSRVGTVVGTGDGAEYAIDEVEIFNRVLTAQDILAIYHADSAGKCRTPANRTGVVPIPVPPVRRLPFR